MPDAPREEALARSMNAGLLPPAFPFRREVEFAGTRHDSIDRICFYDSWWPKDDAVCFVTASLASGGIDGALAAASLKNLLRAALDEFRSPQAALTACGRLVGPETGIAVAVLDLRSGAAMTAALGSGVFVSQPREAGGDAGIALPPGGHLWIAAGAHPPAPPQPSANQSASEIVEAAGSSLEPGGVLGLIRFKGRGRLSDGATSETISITNENGQIAKAIARMEIFRMRCGIKEDAFVGLDLAVDELLTNLVSYAFRDGRRHRIDVELDFSGERLCIEIRDDGIPFNPLDIPAPKLDSELDDREVGGLGMHFVRNIADEMSYRREANWNILRLSKNMGSPSGTGGGSA